MPPRPHSGLWEDTTSSLSSGASCQSGGSTGGQDAQSVEGSDSSLHCWGRVLWGWPLGTATIRATVTPLPREGLQLYVWVPHRTQAGSLRHDTGAWAGLALGRCLWHEEDDWESASQRGREEERREAWSWRVGAVGQAGRW